MMEPLRFFVELTHNGPMPARRAVREDGKTQYLISESGNFFHTDPEIYYTFSSSEPPLQIKVTVSASESGYYEYCFRFFYRLDGGALRQWCSDKYCIYTNVG
ncbi:hypothetical protein [Chitinophaga pinensis]|uniref:Uncharacterized protein n=1 Tax=Chitinophaga pinensis TaxID=79329 RepID=A0A5C6LJ24_9BACT|nr:hypothetical protein [Chitinophaga pinensis]TWV89102.1 hypothetical protein FEF09_30170 [Chitinophaga pinensis]